MEFLNVLNENSALIQALATVVLIIVTVGLCCATIKMATSSKETSEATKLLVDENRKLREDAKRPQMSAKLKPMVEHGDFIKLILNNSGRGVALNVRFQLEGDEEDFNSHEMTSLRGTSGPINFMSQGESEIYELGAGRTLFAEPPMKPFLVVVNYEDVDGQLYEKKIVLDVKQFENLEWQGASVAWRQMEATENIAKHFKGLLKDRAGVHATRCPK